ncbi:MAG: type I-E CRISPR-associated protein Cas5/CasD [Gemmatimonas sp.]
MTSFLMFTIQAPLASWGEIAVGEWRGSWDTPSRSAVIGLVGAALGVERSDTVLQAALRDGYRVAVRADRKGSAMQDYHTMQSVEQGIVKKRNLRTRASLWTVPKESRQTILSRREYRQNVVHTVAVWSVGQAQWSLEDLARSLERPVYAPFAGRRCNPLGLPMMPAVVDADTLAGAFAQRKPIHDWCAGMLAMLKPSRPRAAGRNEDVQADFESADRWGREVAHDATEGFESGCESTGTKIVRRRDVPLNRDGWLFSERGMVISQLPSVEGGT